MSREATKMPFKFDAWHTKKGVWFQADEIELHQLTLLPASGRFISAARAGPQFSLICDWLIPVAYTGVKDFNGTEARDNDSVIFEAGVTGGKAQGVVCWHRNGWHIRYMLCNLCQPVCDLALEISVVCVERKPACDPLPLGSSPFWITGNMHETDFKYKEAEADAGQSELVGS